MELLTPFNFTMTTRQFIELQAFYSAELFVEQCLLLDPPTQIGSTAVPQDLDAITYGQRIDLEEISEDNLLFLPLKVLCEKSEAEILEMNASQVIRFASMVAAERQRLNARDAKDLRYDPDEDEIKAGILKLNNGLFATIDSLAKRMHIDHDAVLQLSQQKVYMMMKIDIDSAKYAKRLRKIIEEKRPRKNT